MLTSLITNLEEPEKQGPVTRGMVARQLEVQLFQEAPFARLPLEMKHRILKFLPIEDKKSARRVCQEWESISNSFLVFNKPPELNDATILSLAKSKFGFSKLNVTNLIKRPVRLPRTIYVTGASIRVLHLDNPAINPNNLEWLLKSCRNLEEFEVSYIQKYYLSCSWGWGTLESADVQMSNFYEFLGKRLPAAIGNCVNLKKLAIFVSVVPFVRITRIGNGTIESLCGWLFDCVGLASCSKLMYFNIRSAEPFYIVHSDLLPTSIIKIDIIMLLKLRRLSDDKRMICKIYTRLFKQFKNSLKSELIPHSPMFDSLRLRFMFNFPSIANCVIVPKELSNLESFWRTVDKENVVQRLGSECRPGFDFAREIDSIIYYTVTKPDPTEAD